MKNDSFFVDTHLFLRYLTDDNPKQADAVERLLRRAADGKIKLVTNSLVFAETIWTLENYYHLDRMDIQNKAIAILNTKGLEVMDGDLILKAIFWYGEKNVDFREAFNVAWMIKNDLNQAYTFDQTNFKRFEGIKIETPK
jgi:predicted nucleic-acid-binding protein